MSVNAALTAGELTALASADQTCPVYLSYEPNTEVGHATIDGAPTIFPFWALTVKSASAGWTDQRVGQTVIITNGATIRGYYRVRAVGDATHLYVGELTDADPGLINILSRPYGIQDGDTATIYERYDLWSVKPYTSGGTLYQDYNVAVGTYNSVPQPIVNVAINGQPGDYFATVANGATKTISAVISVTKHPTSSGSTLTYAWTYPASFTNVTGDTTATFGADVPVGSHRVYCTVTDSIGGALTITRWLRIHSPADPPLSIFPPSADVRNRQGRQLTLRLKQSTISVIPAGARCGVWSDGTWGGAAVASATQKFIGFAVQQPFTDKAGYHESELELLGPCGVLDRLHGYAAAFSYDGTTATWENLATTLSTVHFMQWWLLRWRCANVLETFNYTPISTSGTINLRKAVSVAPGSLYSQLKYLTDMLDANIGSRSDGELVCRAHPSMLEDRSAVITRATLSSTTYSFASPLWKRHGEAGAARYDGYVSDLTADTRVSAQAPGSDSLGQHSGSASGNEKCFASQQDANERAGRALARANNEYPQIQLEIPNNWDVWEPVDMDRTVIQVAAAKSPTGSAISITALPTSITKQWVGGRRAKIGWQGEAETDGVAGQTILVPPQSASTNRYSRYSPSRAPTAVTGIGTPTHNGYTVLALESAALGITTNWGNTTPSWTGIAKPAGTLWMLILDPASAFLGPGQTGNLGAWALSTNGLYYTPNILTLTPTWTLENALSPGVTGGIIRASTTTPGVVYAAWVNDPGTNASYVYTARFSAYGATTTWTNTLGTQSNGEWTIGMDIDQYGSDEMLVGVRHVADATNGAVVYRILNGTPTALTGTKLVNPPDGAGIVFVQKPLFTWAGATNNGVSSTECFLYNGADGTGAYYLNKTTDGGTTVVNVKPADMYEPTTGSSVCYTTEPNRLAFVDLLGTGLYTSPDGGANWTSRGGTGGLTSRTSGYFPRLLAGNYALYMGGTTGMAYSPDFGATLLDKTGNWASAIGAITYVHSVIPLY